MLDEAARRYSEVRAGERPGEQRGWEPGLRHAVEAEYGVKAEAFGSLQYEIVRLAEERAQSVLTMRRSEIAAALPASGGDWSPFLERLTLVRRAAWTDRASGLSEGDIDFGRFDRRFSLINRPLLALN